MLGRIFYNIFIIGTIISICIFPLLLFLNTNKYKYKFKSIYRIFIFISLIFILPINSIRFSKIRNITYDNKMEQIVTTEEISPILEDNDSIIKFGNEIEVKNNTILNLSKKLPYIWIFISAILIIYNFINYIVFLYNQKKYYKFEINDNLNEIIKNISTDMNLKKVNFCMSNYILTPMTVGFFKKTIVLPVDDLSEKEYEFIIKHELSHIKSKDIEYKFMLMFLKCIYWFNPIIYFFVNQVDEILELKCDESVLLNKNENYRKEYANVLLSQIEKNRKNNLEFSINFANRRKNIMKRFENIMSKSEKKNMFIIIVATLIILIICALFIICIPNINFAATEENTIIIKNNDNMETTSQSIKEKTENDKLQFMNPLGNDYVITCPFGKMNNNTNHTGMDLYVTKTNIYQNKDATVDSGIPIMAAESGKVVLAKYYGAYGNLVVISHTDSIQTFYAHCKEIKVVEGQDVSKGDIIAYVGSTGQSTRTTFTF